MRAISSQYIVLLVLVVVIVFGNYLLPNDVNEPVSEKITEEVSACRLENGQCEIKIKDQILNVEIIGELRPLKQFVIKIVDPEKVLSKAKVSFQMKAMQMGINEYSFIRSADAGYWLADVVVPVCTTGRRDWLIKLLVNSDEIKKIFVFEVKI